MIVEKSFKMTDDKITVDKMMVEKMTHLDPEQNDSGLLQSTQSQLTK